MAESQEETKGVTDGLEFQQVQSRNWTGRYARVEGDTPVLHVKQIEGGWRIMVCWRRDGYKGICIAVDEPDVGRLVSAVVQAKRGLGGNGGGSFQINEFGQVLVPASDGGGRRSLVGNVRGALRFEDPFEDRTFTLGDDTGLNPGDAWRLPYVGMPFNLHRRDRVYFWREDHSRAYAGTRRVGSLGL